MNDTLADLPAWLADAWDRHADHPDEVAAGLQARAGTLPDEGDGADAMRLAEHVMLGHQVDTVALEAFLAALPAVARQAGLAGAVQQAHYAIAAVRDQPRPVVGTLQRWRALHDIALARVAQGRATEAQAELLAEEAAAIAAADPASPAADGAAARAYAASANNIAAGLVPSPAPGAAPTSTPALSAATTALMLTAASVARRAWGRAGTWLHAERAEY